MSKTLSVKNAKDWKTTVAGVIAAVFAIVGVLWPEAIDPETQEVIKTSLNEIMIGVAALIGVIVSIFGKD